MELELETTSIFLELGASSENPVPALQTVWNSSFCNQAHVVAATLKMWMESLTCHGICKEQPPHQ